MADALGVQNALPPGYRVQRYEIERVLGVGGFAITYLSRSTGLDKQWAVKEYMPNGLCLRVGTTVRPISNADQDDFRWGLERFLDEARTIASIDHDNVVRVHDFFRSNETSYLVMEYMRGLTLAQILEARPGPLNGQQLARLVDPLCAGLDAVHRAGFLHRDIKPANIYVRRRDEQPVLIDFGAARQKVSRHSQRLTEMFSVGYSPPEQYEADGNQGRWSDIYALCATLFACCVGRQPPESTGRSYALLRGHPDPLPDLRSDPDLVAAHDPGLLAMIMAGLQIDERDRPQDLDELLRIRDSGAVAGPSARFGGGREAGGAAAAGGEVDSAASPATGSESCRICGTPTAAGQRCPACGELSATTVGGASDAVPMGIFRALFSLYGRLGRLDYLLFGLLPGLFLPAAVLGLIGSDGEPSEAVIVGALVFMVITLWTGGIAVPVKRLHDLGKSGWIVLCQLVPYAGPIALFIYLQFFAGQEEANEYGPPPPERPGAMLILGIELTVLILLIAFSLAALGL